MKRQRLAGVAAAAQAGVLDAAALRDRPRTEALDALLAIPGLGPFSAELVLVRGAGEPDHFPASERRLQAAMREAYHQPDADEAALAQVAAAWAPYRSWASLLLRAGREERR